VSHDRRAIGKRSRLNRRSESGFRFQQAKYLSQDLTPCLFKFDRFRHEFNFERPHEALDQQTPASLYEASTRAMPTKLPPLEYPDRFEVRYVSANGGIRWNKQWVNVSTVCAGEYVGLEEIDDGLWNVYFGPLKLGRLIERQMRIEDALGRLKRVNV
jgi:putative transposase